GQSRLSERFPGAGDLVEQLEPPRSVRLGKLCLERADQHPALIARAIHGLQQLRRSSPRWALRKSDRLQRAHRAGVAGTEPKHVLQSLQPARCVVQRCNLQLPEPKLEVYRSL